MALKTLAKYAVLATAGLLSAALAAGGKSALKPKPNIVFILTDDNGWAGVGYNNAQLSTPNLDSLASGGLKLTSHYVYKYCAPTRGAFLTGRFPYKLAATRANFIPWTLPDGTHLNYSMIPRRLGQYGYRSVHVGKWHQGLFRPDYTPIGRGFNKSVGFLEGGEDHNTSKTFGNACKKGEVDLSLGVSGPSGNPFPYQWPAQCLQWSMMPGVALHSYFDHESVDVDGYNPWTTKKFDEQEGCKRLCENRVGCQGYSYRKVDSTHPYFHNCFLVKKDGGGHPVNTAFDSAVCTKRVGATTKSMCGLAAQRDPCQTS